MDEQVPVPTPEPVAPMPVPEKKPITSVDQANDAIEAMKAENDRTEALMNMQQSIVERQEALRASEILGGKADAGQVPEAPKELTDKEYKDKVMRNEI